MQIARSVVFVFTSLFFVDFVFCLPLESLSADKEGVCSVKIRSPRTRTKFYTVASNKWCGKKKCIIKKSKVEKYTVTTTQLACCNGWEYSEDRCVPLCSTGCAGGRCIAPERCQCNPPSYLDLDKNNTCITPKCEPACLNAACQNNTCDCLDGFIKLNSTHCQPKCDEGFRNDVANLSCKPNCEECANGNCTGPDTCVCLEGYKRDINGTCAPICEPPCGNGSCVGVDLCRCDDGYSFDNETKKCEPESVGCSGECTAPNTCQCHEGFKETNGTCQPVCDPCVNGTCSEPGVCLCGQGLVLRDGVCIRGCAGLCNGTCVGEECMEGGSCKRILYKTTKQKKGTVRVLHPYRCGPRGSNWCKRWQNDPKFVDVTETKIECCFGWDYEPDDTCRPVCRHGCFDGQCVLPDSCQCEPPLILQNNSHCVPPTCEPACVNAWCSAPNNCTCNPDFEPYNSTHCALKCQPDFYNDPITLACRPLCDSPCINGTCSGLNRCSCIEGYQLDSGNQFQCVPKCEPYCVNATCSSPNMCSCLEGYEAADDAWACKPRCENCQNGQCVEPGKCQCNPGYLLKEGSCTPECEQPCTNGFCSEPNVCTCHLGYAANDTDKFSCHPVCEPQCANASCESPNKCSCFEGYEAADNNWSCRPVCLGMCKNGLCTAPDECSCNEGYLKNETDSSACYKPCQGPCEMGVCTDLGVCLCNSGFELMNETCIAITPVDCNSCQSNCSDGICHCTNGTPCFAAPERVSMAGLEKTWLIGSAVCLLLLTLLCVVIERTWRRRKPASHKTADPAENETLYSSVIYTPANGTLMARHSQPEGTPLAPQTLTDGCELNHVSGVEMVSNTLDSEEGNVLLRPQMQ